MKIEPARDGRSARMTHESATDVAAQQTIRPLRDHIVIEPLNVVLSKHLIIKEETKPLRGIVRAVGPGHYPLCYDHPEKHIRKEMWESEIFLPITLKVGDVVELGGYDYRGYSFQTFYWGEKLHLICREADVSGVINGLSAERARMEHETWTI